MRSAAAVIAAVVGAGCFAGAASDAPIDAGAADAGVAIDASSADAEGPVLRRGDDASADASVVDAVDAVDAVADADADAATADALNAPTWTFVYGTYLQAGATVGHCGNTGCHDTLNRGIQCDTAFDCYDTMQTVGYIDGTRSPIVVRGQSMLSWYGGFMPQDTAPTSAPDAQRDMEAWVAAGAQRN